MPEESKPQKKTKISFEKALSRLEDIVARLESGQASLDETIRLFEEGKRLGEECGRQLTEYEKRFQIVTEKEDGEVLLTDFDEQQAEEK